MKRSVAKTRTPHRLSAFRLADLQLARVKNSHDLGGEDGLCPFKLGIRIAEIAEYVTAAAHTTSSFFDQLTTRNGATFSASRFSPIARAMNRAVIGVPS